MWRNAAPVLTSIQGTLTPENVAFVLDHALKLARERSACEVGPVGARLQEIENAMRRLVEHPERGYLLEGMLRVTVSVARSTGPGPRDREVAGGCSVRLPTRGITRMQPEWAWAAQPGSVPQITGVPTARIPVRCATPKRRPS
jgi:hypothetical protein